MNKELIALVGSGPSLIKEDLELLGTIPTFSFNRSFLIFDSWGFHPTYYGCLDPIPVEDLCEQIETNVLNNTEAEIFLNETGRNLYKEHQRYKFLKIEPGLPFSASTTHISDLGSAGAISTQIAAGLGFKKILLLGMDGSYNLTSSGAINHFTPDYLKGLRTNPDFDLNNMKLGWETAALGCAEFQIEVINASRKTALECFPKKPLKEALLCLLG